ncbi:MAG TPA: wax ester/triacylglycerol synthase domain-containing protein [Propionibacteriaceae bacterium]|nr:wax ester/triacylglycerol synthase domain-containing protein [Propionibacteriaceae bacterium]
MVSRPRGERLSAADASNVVMDARDQVNVFLMAGTLGVGGWVAEGGRLDLAALRNEMDGRLRAWSPDLTRFSQRVRFAGRIPEWERCALDLTWHVRDVDPVDGLDGLAALCGTLMVTPLPVDRPLWELLIVPGASDAGPGVVLRVHHAVADGVAGVRVVQRLFGDSDPEPASSREAVRPSPKPRRRWRAWVTSVSRVTAVFRTTVPPTVLLGHIGPRRGVAFADVELASLSRSAKAAGATVNDALLAAVGLATEAVLRADGQPVPAVLPASVPVALPDRGTSGNAVGVMLVPLTTGEPDAGVRLARIADTTRAARSEARAQGTYELTRTRWGARLFAWLARRQRFIALFVTNVRGPDHRLSLAGAPLERAWPIAPIQGNVRLGVAAMSYAGRLAVAAHVDADALHADKLGRALGDALTRIAATGPSRRTSG